MTRRLVLTDSRWSSVLKRHAQPDRAVTASRIAISIAEEASIMDRPSPDRSRAIGLRLHLGAELWSCHHISPNIRRKRPRRCSSGDAGASLRRRGGQVRSRRSAAQLCVRGLHRGPKVWFACARRQHAWACALPSRSPPVPRSTARDEKKSPTLRPSTCAVAYPSDLDVELADHSEHPPPIHPSTHPQRRHLRAPTGINSIRPSAQQPDTHLAQDS